MTKNLSRLLILCWVSLPFTVGYTVQATVDAHAETRAAPTLVLVWLVYALGTVSSFVPNPLTLTIQRLLAPLPMLAVVVAAVITNPLSMLWWCIAGAHSAATMVVALSPFVSDSCVNALSYGNEVRFAMRVPLQFAVGPMPSAWILSATLTVTAWWGWTTDRPWWAAISTVLGVAAWAITFRGFHHMTRRCVVFVPAGITFIDHLIAAEPFLIRTSEAQLVDADSIPGALDLAGNPLGQPLGLIAQPPAEVTLRVAKSVAELRQVDALVFNVARAQAFLATAISRGIAAHQDTLAASE